MRAHSAKLRAAGRRIGCVPTMGALHQGHLSLMEYARQNCDHLAMSIFVNPMQFNNPDDLTGYPRTFESDVAKCAQLGVDVLYAPGPDQVYPEGFLTKVSVAKMTQGLCGAHRPGHFDGVTTVVLKLFNTVLPHFAVFGEKDYQQLQVIKRMAIDLDLAVQVIGRPTVREPDGLALSSRNHHLDPAQRREALCLYRALNLAREKIGQGASLDQALAAAKDEIAATPQAELEYLEVVDAASLQPLRSLDGPARLCLAVWIGRTRLIDNMPLGDA